MGGEGPRPSPLPPPFAHIYLLVLTVELNTLIFLLENIVGRNINGGGIFNHNQDSLDLVETWKLG